MELDCDVQGRGHPILCLSGFASGRWILGPLADALNAAGCETIRPDNRGVGASPPSPGPYAMADLAVDALGVMNRLGCARFSVLGVSMGGHIAQELALIAPGRIASLHLLCTTGGGAAFAGLFPRMVEAQAAALYRLPDLDHARVILEPPISPVLKSDFPEAYAYLLRNRQARLEPRREVIFQFRAMAAFFDQALPLAGITAPAQVISATLDPVFPPVCGQRLAESIPGARFHEMAGTDHLFFVERPVETARLIAGFLAKSPGLTGAA